MTSKNIVLIGFMGTGKTSVGKILAAKLNRKLVDVDQRIEEKEKRKIGEIFENDGEPQFRALEKEMIREVSKERGIVITTGGGAVLDPENVGALKENGQLVLLKASPETILERVKRSKHRPLLKGEDRLAQIKRLLIQREPFYHCADVEIETDGLSAVPVAKMILEKFVHEDPA